MCEAKTYSDGDSEFCDACPSYSVNPSTGQTACMCKAGYYMEASECVKCEMNTFNPSVGATGAGRVSRAQNGENLWKGSPSGR